MVISVEIHREKKQSLPFILKSTYLQQKKTEINEMSKAIIPKYVSWVQNEQQFSNYLKLLIYYRLFAEIVKHVV